MENTLEKVFINRNLGIKFKSYIDQKLRVWFQAKQVATILGYHDTNQAIRKHVSENHKRTFLFCCPPKTGGQQNNTKVKCCPVESTGQQNNTKVKCCPVESHGQQNDTRGKCCQCESHGQQNDTRGKYCIFLDEAGFYELVFRSRLPTAKFFREWVFSKVLPSIRKYGYYKFRDTRIKQRVIIDGVKYYKHPVFSNYAANKNGDIYSLKRKKINKNKDSNRYLFFIICSNKLEKQKFYYQHRFVYEVFRGPIPHGFEVDHIFPVKSDNRIKNLQLLTHKQNVEKSNNRPIISTCISTGKERRFISIKKAAIDLDINAGTISNICCKRKSYKSATSKKDKQKYTFRYLD